MVSSDYYEAILTEEDNIYANPICFGCNAEIEDKNFSSMMIKHGFIVFHDKCFDKMLEAFAARHGIEDQLREVAN